MSHRPPPGRRVRGIRLADVPLPTRRFYAEVLLRREDNALRRFEILMAANAPSERVYFVPADAVEAVLGP